MKVGVKIDGVMVLTGIAIAGAIYVYTKRKSILEAFDPTSDKNITYRTVNAVAGEQNVAAAGDYFFGAIDLLNPWADKTRRDYALSVYGFGVSE